jgi:hypothetical protein
VLRIKGCNYSLSETQICSWIEIYGEIEGNLIEEAVIDEVDNTNMGTGAYLVKVRL